MHNKIEMIILDQLTTFLYVLLTLGVRDKQY